MSPELLNSSGTKNSTGEADRPRSAKGGAFSRSRVARSRAARPWIDSSSSQHFATAWLRQTVPPRGRIRAYRPETMIHDERTAWIAHLGHN